VFAVGLLVLVATRAVAAPGPAAGQDRFDDALDDADDADGADSPDPLDDAEPLDDLDPVEPLDDLDPVDPLDGEHGRAARDDLAEHASDGAVDLEGVLDDPALADDPALRALIETGAVDGAGVVDAADLDEVGLARPRPSRWGRLELAIAWRRTWTPPPIAISLGPLPHDPVARSYATADAVLVVATWRR